MVILRFHATPTTDCFLLLLLIAPQLEYKPVRVSDPACVEVQPHSDVNNVFVYYEGSVLLGI